VRFGGFGDAVLSDFGSLGRQYNGDGAPNAYNTTETQITTDAAELR